MKFNIYAGFLDKCELIETGEYPNSEVATKVAEQHAYDIYYQNPTRDILEIAKQDGVNEDTAEIIFILEMIDAVEFFVSEADSE